MRVVIIGAAIVLSSGAFAQSVDLDTSYRICENHRTWDGPFSYKWEPDFAEKCTAIKAAVEARHAAEKKAAVDKNTVEDKKTLGLEGK